MAKEKICIMFQGGVELILETEEWDERVQEFFAKSPPRSMNTQNWCMVNGVVIYTNHVLWVRKLD